MKKKEMVKDALKEEFQSSFGVNASVPDPVDVGDTHAGRAADQVSEPDNKPEAYEDGQPGTEPPTPRTEILAHLFDRLHSMGTDRKSTRLNSSHHSISYAVFCLKKKKYTSQTNDLHVRIVTGLHQNVLWLVP